MNNEEINSEKLVKLAKTDFTTASLDSLAINRSALELHESDIPVGASKEDLDRIRKESAMLDMETFLQIVSGLDRHLDMTAGGVGERNVQITDEIARKLKDVIQKIETLISFLRKQALTTEEKRIVAEVEQKIPKMKIYAQGA